MRVLATYAPVESEYDPKRTIAVASAHFGPKQTSKPGGGVRCLQCGCGQPMGRGGPQFGNLFKNVAR